MRKRIRYRSDNGLIFEFGDRAPYFLEKIDAASISGVFTTDIIPDCVGQVTTSRTFGARTVECELAVTFDSPDMELFKKQILSEITECFNPLSNGTLEIETDTGVYEINCYPQESPKFDNGKLPYIYRFTVDLVCDYPYFKNKRVNKKDLPANTSIIINSSSVIDNREIIITIPSFDENFTLTNKSTNKEIRLIKFGGGKVVLDVLNYSLTAVGNVDVSQFIDVNCDIENFCLKRGKNELLSNLDSMIEYRDILLGVT